MSKRGYERTLLCNRTRKFRNLDGFSLLVCLVTSIALMMTVGPDPFDIQF